MTLSLILSMSAGKVLPGTSIAVDFWCLRLCPPSVQLFFLTHMHTDHIVGLKPSWNCPIYCTPVTKKLLFHKCKFAQEDIVCELEVNESHAIKYGNDETVTVTPFDANHCAGAAMFLFEGNFGRILYTGDFRYSGSMLNDDRLHSLCTANVIDVLYLDNTFCDPRCVFPSREDAVVEMLQIIRSYPDAEIKIGLRNLGKEQMLVTLARSLGEWIGVSQERYCILEILRMANVFKVSSSLRIQAVILSEITVKNMTDWNFEKQTIAIIPTGISIALDRSVFPQRDDIHIVPYTDHSSYNELQEFVSLIKPRKIFPVLGHDVKDRLSRSLPNRADMSCFGVTVGDDDGNNLVVSPEQQSSASCSSYSTNTNKSSVETTQSGTRKMNKRKGFTFKKKIEMGVVFSSSQSPTKRPKDAAEQSVVTAADSPGMTAEDTDATKPTEANCLSRDDDVCDTTTEVNNEEQHHGDSDEVLPLQHNSVHPTSDDRNLMNGDEAETDLRNSNIRNRSVLNLDSLDTGWMLQVLQPLISQEASKIISDKRHFCKSFK